MGVRHRDHHPGIYMETTTRKGQSAMDTYRRQSRQIVDNFLDRSVSFPDCIAALDAALADFMSRFTTEQLDSVRDRNPSSHAYCIDRQKSCSKGVGRLKTLGRIFLKRLKHTNSSSSLGRSGLKARLFSEACIMSTG